MAIFLECFIFLLFIKSDYCDEQCYTEWAETKFNLRNRALVEMKMKEFRLFFTLAQGRYVLA